ncbi:unnamed protein product [Sympodiomycopsis kandeliae]
MKSDAAPPAGSSRPKSKNIIQDLILYTLPEWSLILSLIFGGCCSNAYFLELSTSQIPNLGTLITLLHFTSTMLVALPSQIDTHSLKWKKNRVPLYRWLVQVVLYCSTSLLNNIAFGFNVPMPVHIIFRSGGLVVNMIMGWLIRGKRYSLVQIVSVILVTGGVILATLSTSPPEDHKKTDSSPSSSYVIGISLLSLALVLSSIMGIWQELTFAKYGKDNWQESLFYSHFFSLPLLLIQRGNLSKEISLVMNSPKTEWIGFTLPSVVPLLVYNVLTQLACINGVNRLTSKISSVGVTLVLVVRKAISLAISVLLVGGKGNDNMELLTIGALAVGIGTVGYTWSSSGASASSKKKEAMTSRNEQEAGTSSQVQQHRNGSSSRKRDTVRT